jgi:hypothetical protein
MRKIAVIAAMLAFTACSDDPSDPGNDPALSLSADSVSVTVGGNTTVAATILNSTAIAQFSSRDNTIAEVNATGTITGIRTGRTVVVSTLPGTNARDSVIVNVTGSAALRLPLLGTGFVAERHTAEIAVAEPYAYTTTWGFRAAPGNAIKIWNVTGNTPILLDSLILSGAGTVSDIQISSDGALIVASTESGGATNNGIAIFDRSNPAKPVLITRYTSATAGQGVHTVKLGRINNRHYAFLSVNPSGSQRAKLAIIDITDPANPVETAVREMGNPFIHDVFIRDGILFTALWHTGLTIYDVGGGSMGGSPSNPVAMGTVKTAACSTCSPTSSSVHNVWWFHDPSTNGKRYAFIGEEGPSNLGGSLRASGAVHVVDVSNMTAPLEVAVYQPDSTTTWSGQMAGAHNFVMDEASGILYAAFYNGGVRALDVRGDLSVCTAAQKTADGRCDLLKMGREVGVALSDPGVLRFVWGVALQGNNLYASDMPNGIHKINISALKR